MKRLLIVAASALVLVLAACGGSQRVPKGVGEIDVRAPGRISQKPNHPNPGISRRVTDPSQVKDISRWFDSLKPPGKTSYGCAGGPAASVRFTFRSANGAELARAYSAPTAAGPCDPIHFTVDGQPEVFLVDTNQATPLIQQVQHLLGVKFHNDLYLG
jgi:hypothetical protein